VELYAIDGGFLNLVCAILPDLAARFFHYLSTQLAATFDSREKALK
jgi:hypothetical protein